MSPPLRTRAIARASSSSSLACSACARAARAVCECVANATLEQAYPAQVGRISAARRWSYARFGERAPRTIEQASAGSARRTRASVNSTSARCSPRRRLDANNSSRIAASTAAVTGQAMRLGGRERRRRRADGSAAGVSVCGDLAELRRGGRRPRPSAFGAARSSVAATAPRLVPRRRAPDDALAPPRRRPRQRGKRAPRGVRHGVASS